MLKFIKILVLLLGLMPVCVFAQIPSKMEFNGDLTPADKFIVPEPGQEILVVGTHVSMYPPEHFLISEQLPGFIHAGTSATIRVSEIEGTSYVMIKSSMTEEHFKKEKFTLIEQKEIITANGQSGVLYRLRFTSRGVDYERLMLFSGDYNNTVCVNVSYPAISHDLLYEKIEESLLTAHYIKTYD